MTESLIHVNVKDVYADAEFNCRGNISKISVVSLADDIKENGLLAPIIISERREGTPEEYKYTIIAGHRRHLACQVAGLEIIPALVKDEVDEFKCRQINAVENLKREDLNLMEEAACVKPFLDKGYGRSQIAEALGMSPGWVQLRTELLALPEDIQTEAAAGVINQIQIKQLYKLKDPAVQLEYTKTIKKMHERGSSAVVITNNLVKKINPNRKGARKPAEMTQMIENLLPTTDTCLATRALAWASGNLHDAEFHKAVKDEYPDFVIPTYLEKFIKA